MTAENVTVTAVIPTRNRPASLRAAIESVLQQGPNVEAVVVDEASEPPASAGLAGYGRRVRVVRHDAARGPSGARNAGVDAARGEYVGFLDDDDTWLPRKVAECLECFARWPRAGVVAHLVNFHGSTREGDGSGRLLPTPVAHLLHTQPPHVDAVLVRRDVHQRVRFDESFLAAEDLDYMVRLAQLADFVFLDRVLAEHGPSNERVSAISLDRRIEFRLRFREKHRELFDREADAFFHLRLGHLYRRCGRSRDAARAFLRSARLQPGTALPWKGLGQLAVPPHVVDRIARR